LRKADTFSSLIETEYGFPCDETPFPALPESSMVIYKQQEQGFEKKEISLIIHQTKERTGRVNLSKICHPTSKRKFLLFKGLLRGLSLNM
jgi:hypothetical protein